MKASGIAQIILGLTAIAALIVFFGVDQVSEAFAGVTLLAIGILFLLQLTTLLAGAWIWHFLLNRGGRISFAQVFLINQAAGVIESLTPSVKFGGEAAKIYLFRQRTAQSYQSLAGILIMQKFLTLIPFVFFCVLLFLPALHFFELALSLKVSLVLLLIFSAALGWLCYGKDRKSFSSSHAQADGRFESGIQNRLLRFISRTRNFLDQARISARGLLSVRHTMGILLVSFLVWVFYPVKVYLACHFLGMDVNPLIIGLATLFAYMIAMVPLMPGGLGTYEGTMALFLTLGGLDPAEGLAVSLLSRLTTFWFPLFLSILSCLALTLENRIFSGRIAADPGFER